MRNIERAAQGSMKTEREQRQIYSIEMETRHRDVKLPTHSHNTHKIQSQKAFKLMQKWLGETNK